MHYPIPQELTAFSAQLPTPLYAVGGFVRDTLLGKESHDIDLCSSLLPEQIQAYAQSAGIPCPLVNSKLGTVLLCFGENRYEHWKLYGAVPACISDRLTRAACII